MKIVSMVLSLVLLLTVMAVSADSDRKYIVLQREAAKTAPFSEAVLAGNTLYIAGHLGLDPKTGKPGATPEEEARLVMESLKRTVEAAGLSMDDMVSVQVFCSDVSVFDAFNSVYRTYFHGNYPARAFIGAGKLLFGARFEVQGIAVKR
ncbi:MAG TPA: Rid family hydrolase [Candidatus Angelobacter sp.]|jgi:reactive intermediate/imine deaminase|nr:Rid family hydrolase [Candidatus Angelobacter sp.]